MANAKIAFYKADGPHATFIDKLIAWYTKGPYSHVEFVFQDNDGNWKMCSSSPRDGKVRCKPHTFDDKSWTYIDIELDDDKLNTIKEFYNSILGFKYDWAGILGFILPTQDRQYRWFCSETVSNALKITGFKPMWYLDPSRVSPNKLYKLLRDYYN